MKFVDTFVLIRFEMQGDCTAFSKFAALSGVDLSIPIVQVLIVRYFAGWLLLNIHLTMV